MTYREIRILAATEPGNVLAQIAKVAVDHGKFKNIGDGWHCNGLIHYFPNNSINQPEAEVIACDCA